VTGRGAPSREAIAAAPRFGTCWKLTSLDFGTPLDQPERRPCSGPHDTETIWVANDTLDPSLPYPTEAETETSSGAVGKALDDACDLVTVDTYLGDDAARHVPFVSWWPRLPSREQWAAGARWIRCDIVYGVDAPQLAPGRMAGGLKGPRTSDYRACYAGSPTVNRVVSCSAPHEAEIVTGALDLPAGVPFPTQERPRQAMADSGCGRELDPVLGTSPSPAGFRLDLYLGSRDSTTGTVAVSCVLVRDDGAESTTAVLP
jgi:hypothetical protein